MRGGDWVGSGVDGDWGGGLKELGEEVRDGGEAEQGREREGLGVSSRDGVWGGVFDSGGGGGGDG